MLGNLVENYPPLLTPHNINLSFNSSRFSVAPTPVTTTFPAAVAIGGLPLNETALPEVLKAQVRRAQSRHPFRPYCALLPTALVALAGRARLSQRVTPRCHAATHATFLFAPLLSPP